MALFIKGARHASCIISRFYSSPAVVVPRMINEPMLSFSRDSSERTELQNVLKELKDGGSQEIPCVVGGREVFTGNIMKRECPYDVSRTVATYHYATKELIQEAIDCSLKAREEWDNLPYEHRAAVFLKAADLISTKYRYHLLATTMIGQGKTAFQAEIDATCELIDFYRYAVEAANDMYWTQPPHNPKGVWNRLEYRGLEGFVASISPFNFTAIGGNLGGTPTLMGNVTVWKPSDAAILSNWYVFKVLREAGVPDGVINFVPAPPQDFGDTVTASPHLSAISFTGSAKTFKHLWKQVGANIESYRSFPRLVGECGGKNFHLIHETADLQSVINGTLRSGFEYSGQKCSACSRVYVPESVWSQIKDEFLNQVKDIKVGPGEDFTSFTSSVIDKPAFDKITGYLDYAKSNPELTILAGGESDDSVGYYVQPTVIQTTNPRNKLMSEEIFGPVLTVYVFPDNKWDETLRLIDETSPYGLTGSIYARDRTVIEKARRVLRNATGNLYINDKSTGSVVGQQPFGGSRMSGTNDKSGATSYVFKWVSPISIKETFVPMTTWGYPSVDKN
ncbi:PREDICTED: delta-1-pyrroline-5-carboxylate dehydrogenase, mitochondrial-like [Amphimedon queenslandica]|uniref:Multifunctional fusion protein n=1 Tax=Amphimedon queenslandica TaxID=400682 RepID=A0A1X7VNH4_AMPQE|nr:PREDICTED: delta-1-pyrroline-5-carboxylate dehydrogenase, mitochondrial-like [Amphimedon queenslandica]|eukprot:XP_003383539.2 PREDICTED: delta-1-pyrroline-5-carboxylate dehydrogenase, mitochondrial-like [Amphimedon queenslandica]